MTRPVNTSTAWSDQATADQVELPVKLQGPVLPDATQQPVSGGLCLPKGRLHEVASAWFCSADQRTTAQIEVLSRWSDGSIRWLLASWIATPALQAGPCRLQLNPDAANDSSDEDTPRITLRRSGQRFVIQRSPASLACPKQTELDVLPQLTLQDGTIVEFEFGDVQTEAAGTIRSVYEAHGILTTDRHVHLQLRFEIWPTAGLLQIHTRLLNTRRARHQGGLWDLGDSGSFLFSSLHVVTRLQTGGDSVIRWKAEAGGDIGQLASTDTLKIVQLGSGGPAWDCTNHVGPDEESTVRKQGYAAIVNGATACGLRSEPVIAMETGDSQLTVGVPDFWQMFPSSLEAQDGILRIGLFPDTLEQLHELQGGEQSTQSFWLSTEAVDEKLNSLDWLQHPIRMVQPTATVQQAAVFDWFAGHVDPTNNTSAANAAHRYVTWLKEVTSGNHSITARRESIDEYGWRNFGDVPADHEQTHYSGSNTIISHYNNQFDLIYGGILNQMVSEDGSWRDLFDPLARHVMDIDIYHTDEDRAEFNGGLFWHTDHYVDARTATHRTYSRHNCPEGGDYGGGPSNEHNYATGLLYYYYLTGDPQAAKSVRSLADWVFGLDDGTATVFGLLDDGVSGQASTTVEDAYHGPGRGSGNSISVLLDGWELTKDERYLRKAEELIRRVVHPHQRIDELQLLDAEYRWSYTVCLTSLGRYLAKMVEAGRRGPMYDYVRQTLCHYGQWMVDHERPTLSEPDGLEFVTEAWAAQEFRKANVLRIAASCCDDSELSVRMRRRADELNDAAWRDLYAFGDKHLTARCFSIVMTEGLRDVFHRTHPDHQLPAADQSTDHGEWTMFVPQRTRVRQMLKSPRRLLAALPRLFSVARWCRTLDALRRRL